MCLATASKHEATKPVVAVVTQSTIESAVDTLVLPSTSEAGTVQECATELSTESPSTCMAMDLDAEKKDSSLIVEDNRVLEPQMSSIATLENKGGVTTSCI